MQKWLTGLMIFTFALIFSNAIFGQSATATLRGAVSDGAGNSRSGRQYHLDSSRYRRKEKPDCK
jgi:hypothetical protein